jgi:membrane peptidoglycan carboxypeptidase
MLKKIINKYKLSTARIILLALVGFFLLVLLSYLYIAYLLPIPTSLVLGQNFVSTKIYDRHGELLYEVLNPDQGRKTYLRLDQLPNTFVEAVVASEDSDYYSHVGVDLSAITRAFFYNSLEQKITSGASTITQQLVRNLMDTNRERNLQEKIIESVYAIRLSHAYTKEQVLEQYLNTVYFGNLAYGAPAAALNYFNKNLYDLDLAEQTMLAGLPQSPSNFNPLVNFDKAICFGKDGRAGRNFPDSGGRSRCSATQIPQKQSRNEGSAFCSARLG